MESIEEQRYNEFSNALTESDVLALAKIDLEKLQEETPILVHLPPGRTKLSCPSLLGNLILRPTNTTVSSNPMSCTKVGLGKLYYPPV